MIKFLFPFVLACCTVSAQCDSVDYEVKGTFENNNKKSLTISINDLDPSPKINAMVNISKFGKKDLFGKEMTFWLEIADAEVKEIKPGILVVKIIKEKSEITVNGKKKNQFEKGNQVKVKWKDKAKVVPHVILDEKDTIEVGQYKCDQKIGEWKLFYPYGNLKQKVFYKNDILQGSYETYYEDGTLQEKGRYINGKIEGEVLFYHPNGNIKRNLSLKNGKLNGEAKIYYESGQLKTLKYYNQSRVVGEVIDYYENGNIASKANFNDEEQIHGKVLVYYEDFPEKVKIEREYKNDLKTGYYKEFYENGVLAISTHTINNKINGEYELYHSNGKVKNKGGYKNGIKTGSWKGFYENGEPEFSGDFDEEGNKTGKWTEWDEKGKKTKTKY